MSAGRGRGQGAAGRGAGQCGAGNVRLGAEILLERVRQSPRRCVPRGRTERGLWSGIPVDDNHSLTEVQLLLGLSRPSSPSAWAL